MKANGEQQTGGKWTDESLPLVTRKQLLVEELARLHRAKTHERPEGPTIDRPPARESDGEERAS